MNEGAGARSEGSPLVAAVLILVTVLVLTPVFKNLPEAVLAALIIHAVSHLWKVTEFRRYYRGAPLECWLGLATLLGVITIDVLPGLVIGVVSMLLLVVYHASRPHLGSSAASPACAGAYGDVGRHPDYERIAGLLVLRLEAPLFYANAGPYAIVSRPRRLERPAPARRHPRRRRERPPRHHERGDARAARRERGLGGVDLALADVRQPVLAMMRRSSLLALIGEDRVYHTIDEAIEKLG